jgi:glyoxylase-like metal-dependent hydrolase (beta-lactamase superfamily II)/rhodanese-related sulfurtransferase
VLFRQVINEDLGCASYVVGDAATGTAAVVDPQWDIAPYLQIAAERGLRIAHVIETHTHADHVSGHGRLHEATGATLHVHPLAGAEFPHEPFPDGAEVVLGEVVLRAIHLPGHRPEHTGVVVLDTSRGDRPWAVLTGDSLFVGDVARPDLAVAADEGATDLYDSMTRLLGLPEFVEVYPGHIGGSLCGSAAISEKTSSTIGFEKAAQPLLAIGERDAFVRALTARLGVKPPDLQRVVAMNRGPLLTGVADPPALEPDELWRRAREPGVVVIDGRESAAFDAAHLPGSVSAPLSGSGFATRAAMVTPPDAPLLLVADHADDALEMAHRLAAIGRRTVGGVLAGGFAAWEAQGLPTASLERIMAGDLAARLVAQPDLLVVDVREAHEWEEGHLAGSLHVPYWSLRDADGGVPRGRPLAVVCSAGRRAGVAASVLAARGFGPVVHVDGGGVGACAAGSVEVVAGRAGEQ